MPETLPITEVENNGFFAIIPATVRYDKTLPQGAKLLFGEITALAKKKGYAWAKNAYFAKLYETSERTIISWIQRLRDAGHIKVFFDYFPDSRKVRERHIYPVIDPAPKQAENSDMPDQSDLVVKKSSPLGDLMVKKSSLPGGEENFREISTILFKNINSAAADLGDTEKPPPAAAPPGRKAAATTPPPQKSGNQTLRDPPKNAESTKPEVILALNRHFLELDSALIFDESFYPRALAYLELNGLDFGYATWLYEFCKTRKNLVNLTGFYYTIFCEPRYAELYHAASRPAPVVTIVCPVCGTSHGEQADPCPVCGLKKAWRRDKDTIEEQKWLYAMPPEIRAAYEREQAKIYDGIASHNFKERNLQKNLLDEKYGRPGITRATAEALT